LIKTKKAFTKALNRQLAVFLMICQLCINFLTRLNTCLSAYLITYLPACLPAYLPTPTYLYLPVYTYLSIPTCQYLPIYIYNLRERSARSKALPNSINQLIGSIRSHMTIDARLKVFVLKTLNSNNII
jgi:hypothetical protein